MIKSGLPYRILIKSNLLLVTLVLILPILLTACASVKNIRVNELNSFFKDLSRKHSGIQKVKIQQIGDEYLTVNFQLEQDLAPEVRQTLFERTRDYMQNNQTKKLVCQYLGKKGIECDVLYNRLGVRFENVHTEDYWVYYKTLDTGQWELVTKNIEEVTVSPIH
ncbi:hypothetical protein [Desulfosporosinus sp. I2]|uniref:hypothetical protein n=1 Tax=Desulfosporosinus sp. I2 TaxID=1617025 RepID=UPI0005EF37EE|nr:hypothetical protein [Desulfosporosinus sp. I2]